MTKTYKDLTHSDCLYIINSNKVNYIFIFQLNFQDNIQMLQKVDGVPYNCKYAVKVSYMNNANSKYWNVIFFKDENSTTGITIYGDTVYIDKNEAKSKIIS